VSVGNRFTSVTRLALASFLLWLSGCGNSPWNSPYPAALTESTVLYSSFTERPKHLDPVRAYVSNEYEIIAQIYEPPLQYHYLARPYELVPLAAKEMPTAIYLDEAQHPLPADAPREEIAFTRYEIEIKRGVMYQPHPAFARDQSGRFRYHALTAEQLEPLYRLSDLEQTGTRELVADDFVYQLKRMAHPKLHSPIAGLMSQHIFGLKRYAKTLAREIAQQPDGEWFDLRAYPHPGVEAVDRYRYRITIVGKYPQLIYWLAMPFFSPMPWEAERFYAQPELADKNITLDWYPVGTGPFMLTENNPNRRMVLSRNPNFRGEPYPSKGEQQDKANGLLDDAGKSMPLIDSAIFSLEKETIPYWNKFLQGYYDTSPISSDAFDQAIQFTSAGNVEVTESLRDKGVELVTAVTTSIWYWGFNMNNETIGGASERARKLRLALSIAIDQEEFISIFVNGRGIPAQGPIPPGIFGHRAGRAGINPYVYRWENGRPKRRPLADAKTLLAEAGYPDGRNAETGKPLVLYFDTTATGPDDKARLNWILKQFAKLNIQLIIRATDFNRFQDKVRKGNWQILFWGWNADYPDPENLLFLLYGPNAKVGHDGENAVNYRNPRYDELFVRMKDMDNGPERQRVIDEMVEIARRDAPWIWGFHPQAYSLHHSWYRNVKPNLMANNTLKYKRILPQLRAEKRQRWNRPVLWPLAALGIVVAVSLIPALAAFRRRERMAAK
jgi:oligopeptide transport system substrate-binding protein